MEKFISADSHVVEPRNLFVERMDKRFRDRAPRFETRDDADYLLIEGLAPRPTANFMGGFADQKVKGEALDRARNDRYQALRPGAYEPAARLADQDMDGIAAEVVYPGMCLMVFSAPDVEYKRECLRVYNDWLGEFCSAGSGRLIAVGALPTGGPIEWAVNEAHRIAKMGMAGAIIPMQPKRPFQDPYWEPLFETLQDLNLRPNFHTGVMDDLDAAIGVYGKAGNLIDQNVTGKMAIPAINLTNVLSWGIPQKYPKLTFVGVEQGIGWVASAVRIMDKIWEDHHAWMQP
ncbi:MAG TPA: amidohydrolase family protein, partial [Candidatus Binataceae bacterium]|nr:amidohydrolase family protein [Candidatus Binataceae bacterium]